MILLFKKTKLFFVLASVLWLAAVAVGRLTIFTEFDSAVSGILSPIAAAVCGVYVIYVFATVQAGKMHRAYNAILSDECDADRYVALYEPIRESGRTHRKTVFLTESSYATGLHLAGRSREALEIVTALTERPDFARQSAVDRADAHVDVGIYSLALGELSRTRAAIASAEEILAVMSVGTQEYNRIFREIQRLTHRADVAEGRYDAALEYFTDTSREYTVRYTKVNRMNTLAQIYRGRGDVEQLRRSLVYLDRHGGTLKMAKDARAELETLPPPPEQTDDANEGEE